MHKPEWIIFDVGGVMLNWRRSSADLAKKLDVDRDVLLKTLFEFAPMMNLGKTSPRVGWEKILERLGSREDPDKIIKLWREKKYWYNGTLKLVRDLHMSGYKLAIFTNSWLGLTKKGNKQDLPPEIKLFKFIFDSSVEGLQKPDARFYELVEKKTNSSGRNILFIDDDESNLNSARERNWQVFLISSKGGFHLDDTEDLRRRLKL